MITGSFDKTIQLLDVRADDKNTYLTWNIPNDCECIQWNPLNPQYFVVGTENGTVYYYDVMKGSKSEPVWTINAHSKPASCVAINSLVPLLVTGSVDKSLKLFDIGGVKPKLIENIPWQYGVFSVGFYSDVPNLLAVGSEHNGVKVLDLSSHESVVRTYQQGGSAATAEENATTDDAMMVEGEEDNNTTEKKKKKKNKKKKKTSQKSETM